MRRALCPFACLGVLVLTLLGLLLSPKRDFSPMENRNLAAFPTPSLNAVLSGRFMTALEDALSDQFPIRDGAVRVNATLQYALGRRDRNGAYIGRDGRLFEQRAAGAMLERNLEALDLFAQRLREQGVEAVFLPAYSAHTFYGEALPPFAQASDERALADRLRAALPEGVQLADPYARLAANSTQDVYFRTDHHWTQQGAYLAYLSYMEALGLEPQANLPELVSPHPFYGSLYSKAPLPFIAPDTLRLMLPQVEAQLYYPDEDKTQQGLYDLSALEGKDQYAVFLGTNQGRVEIRTGQTSGRRLLVVKDSFAHALIPLLAPHFDEIVVVDLRYDHRSLAAYMKEKDVTDVLLCMNISWFSADENFFYIKY